MTLLLVCALVVAGCAAGELPFPPTLTVPLPDNDFGKFSLLVYDETGLVTGGHAEDPPDAPASAEVEARTDSNELVVTWLGGSCSHQPYLRVKGDASALELVIAPAPVEISLTPAIQCPAVGIPQRVTLTLAQPVEQAAVEISEIR